MNNRNNTVQVDSHTISTLVYLYFGLSKYLTLGQRGEYITKSPEFQKMFWKALTPALECLSAVYEISYTFFRLSNYFLLYFVVFNR